jgi:hypothetical protein
MQPIQIKPIKKNITIRFAGEKVILPEVLEAKITEHWQQLTQANPRLRNGEVFTVRSVEDTAGDMAVRLAETNYAHYLYSHQIGDLGEHTVRIIHSSALVITSDDKLVFGAMAEHTSRPGIIQCVGGGIDHNDIRGGIVDIEHNTANELNEELGIDPYDTSLVESFSATYLKFGGPTDKMTVIYTPHNPFLGFLANLFMLNFLQSPKTKISSWQQYSSSPLKNKPNSASWLVLPKTLRSLSVFG